MKSCWKMRKEKTNEVFYYLKKKMYQKTLLHDLQYKYNIYLVCLI